MARKRNFTSFPVPHWLQNRYQGIYEDSVWDHLSGPTGPPFEAGDQRQIAVTVIDDRGNELLVAKPLSEVLS